LKRFLFLLLFSCSLPAHAQFNDTSDVFAEVVDWEGITLSAQASQLAQGNGYAYQAFGVQLNDYFSEGFFVRNRYLVGKDYFKFSTAELAVLLVRSDFLTEGADGCREIAGAAFLIGALFALNDGVGYTVPLRRGFYVSPFLSPAEIYFTREPGRHFHGKVAGSAGVEFKKGVRAKGLQCVLGASGEMVYDYLDHAAGYRLNFSLGVPFECW